jgi:hypothetical protein
VISHARGLVGERGIEVEELDCWNEKDIAGSYVSWSVELVLSEVLRIDVESRVVKMWVTENLDWW